MKTTKILWVCLIWLLSLPGYAQLTPFVNKKGKIGFKNEKGKTVIKPKYTEAGEFVNGYAWVKEGKKRNYKTFGYIDSRGKKAIPVKYYYHQNGKKPEDMVHGVVMLEDKKKQPMFVNTRGKKVVKSGKYKSAGQFNHERAMVSRHVSTKGTPGNQRYGYINPEGKEVIPPIYDDVFNGFLGQYTFVKPQGIWMDKRNYSKNPLWEIIDLNGNKLSDGAIADFFTFSLSGGSANKNYSLITRNGSRTVDQRGLATGDWGIVNPEGKLITPLKYHSVEKFNDEGLAMVTSNSLIGWVNLQGVEIVPMEYSEVLDFSEGLATVRKKDGHVNWLNTKGETVLRTQYATATSFRDGLACVTEDGTKWGAIDKEGNLIVPIQLDDSKETRDFINRFTIPNNRRPATQRDFRLFNLYVKRPQDKFKVKDVIPDDMWDY
jgi:hypothetical protein